MKQLLFCCKQNRELIVKHSILTDIFIPIQDVISPQKSTLIIPKTNKVELSDIVIMRENKSGIIEYIGYIDTIANKNNTEISCYPLINVFDNDYVLDEMFETIQQKVIDENGNITETLEEVDADIDVTKWLTKQLTREFIDTDDYLQALPLIIRNQSKKPVFYKKILDTANLLEIYIDLFISTGVYVVFSGLSYNNNKIDGIYCDICSNTDIKPYKLRYDNPQIQNVNIVDNTFSSYNKIIATEELPEDATDEQIANRQRYYFYLLDNNEITREQNDNVRIAEEQRILQEEKRVVYLGRRIKQVRSKEITFSLEGDKGQKENANALLLAVYSELQAPEYNLQITIDMFYNNNLTLYRSVDFTAESGIIYSSNITKIEKLNEKQVRITLGALRNSLTDFKKKVEVI